MMNLPAKSLSRLVSRRGVHLAAAALLAGATFAATAQAAFSSIGKSEVGFLAVGPGGLKIDGKGSGLKASESGGTVTFSVPLKSLKTGMSLRDDHLQEALNSGKHPTAKLAVTRAALKVPADGKSSQTSAKGKFTLNGVTRDVKFDYKAKRTGSDFHIQGRTTLNITDFKLEQPCYLGVCVDKQVKVKVKFKLRDN